MISARTNLARGLLKAGRLLNTRCSIDDAARALVFAPHPDDEVLGCGGTIARKILAGAEVRVAIMTDGRTSHAKLIDVEELIRVRRAEACAAARELGLDPAAYEFLNFPDGELHEHGSAAVAAVSKLIRSFRPQEIYLPHRDDRQDDHVATYRIVHAALADHAGPVNVFEYPVWLWNSWPWTWGSGGTDAGGYLRRASRGAAGIWEIAVRCCERSNISAVRDRKLKALEAYRSQMQRRDGNPRWPIMADVAGGEFIRYFSRSEEVFRPSTRRARAGDSE